LLVVIGLVFSSVPTFAASSAKKTIVIGTSDWPSVNVHAHIVGIIAENGYGYKVEYKNATHTANLLSLRRGDTDIYMESWTDNNVEATVDTINTGRVIDLGSNFKNATQGWFVPTYIIKGDSERGIKAVAPELKSVKDLGEYWELFKDRSDPKKGRLYNAIASWPAYDANVLRLKSYGLEKYYNSFSPGSNTALVAQIVSSYTKGQPILFWYWTPAWIFGSMDFTMLAEKPFSQEIWETTKLCSWPNIKVNIFITSSLAENAPELVSFLANYETTLAENNDFLSYINKQSASDEDAAKYFLKKYQTVWHQWFYIPGDYSRNIINGVNKALGIK
jgi:glycine betaine/proline transport system substrate-binding protein